MNDHDAINAACRDSFDVFAMRAFGIIEPGTEYEWGWYIGCLPYEQPILTEHGYKPIGEVVEGGYSGRVLSYNHDLNKPEWKRITHRFINNRRPLYEMVCSTGEQITLTDNHPVYANGKYIEAEKIQNGDELVRVLPQGIQSLFIPQQEAEILRHAVLRTPQGKGEEPCLPRLQGREVLHSKPLSALLSKVSPSEGGASLRQLRQDAIALPLGYEIHFAQAWSILQSQMLRTICHWKQKAELCKRSLYNEISHWLSRRSEKGIGARQSSLLSLLGSAHSPFRGASHRQKYKEQRAVESDNALSSMPQQTEGRGAGDVETGKCAVLSITRSSRVSEKVYNIEVEGNNNYFANGILVHNCISEHLEAAYRGELSRLIINLPPRCLKSYLVARAFPAWVMGKRASEKFISTSYGYEVTEQNAMACRRIMKSPQYLQMFPDTLISPDLDRNTHFETTQGGQYYAASALSPLTGMGGEWVIVDDPLKPMEAYSDTIRNSTNQNIRTTMFSRFNDKRTGKFVLIMQRVHEDDPTGNLLKDGGYYHLKLPAEAKTHILVTLGEKKWEMQTGELLAPSRLSRAILDQTMLDMTPMNYAGQMLQEPVAVGGGEFLPEWPNHYNPLTIKPKGMNVYILVDAAGGDDTNKKKKKTSDRTAMAVIGLAPDNNYYLLDLVIDRFNATERIDMLFILHKKWNEICSKPPKVGYEKYGLMTDTHYAKKRMSEEGYNFQLIELGGRMAKEERIRRMIPDLQRGRWYFPDTLLYTDTEGRSLDMVKELLDSEMSVFPRARFDDGLDATTRIYDTEMQVVFPRIVKKSVYTREMREQKDSWINW